ncbi:citron Rho-interacting kinase-like [Epinephelus fuscoguttatus]|uniref:citron Rho-interacting kinase-like n=1 Tax=Epinephelus fuscoguttatus TaxID=293821 RepID=UPI0020D087A3|nr:citron Rho-interacting kinase-like [Epinephelus fuscoguttatus]
MDRRTNNRQRPAGDAAGRRRPPQHHHHQHNNASWGDLVDEENQKLCHIIKKKKDQIKRLEELLEARDRGFSSEFKKSAERVCELETQNYDLTLSLQRQEKNSKQQFEEMVAKYEAERQTASNHIKQVLRQEVESQVRSEYQQKEAQMEKQIHQMGAELQKIREEKQSLLLTLADAHTAMTSKDAALQQSEEAWQAKYEALTEKMEENTRRCETQVNEFTIKASLMEEQIHQRDLEILRLTEDNSCLANKLAETAQELTSRAAELLQSQRAWEETLQTVKDNFYKEAEESQQSWESQQTQVRVKVEAEIQQKDAEILRLTKDNNGLIEQLSEKTEELTRKDDELLQSQRAWEETLQTVKDNFYKEAEESQQSWESQQTQVRVKVEAEIQQKDAEILRLTEDNNGLIEKLSEKTEELTRKDDELLQSQRAWEELAEKHQAQVKQLMDEKVELEDLCLYVNKKRKRFLLFPRRSSDDRETQLQKMKNKMQQKAAKARGAEKMEEEMEAADCSAQAGHQ